MVVVMAMVVGEKAEMEGAAAELERRSRHLSALVQQRRNNKYAAEGEVVVVVDEQKKAAAAAAGARAEALPEPPTQQNKSGDGGGGRRDAGPPREQWALVRVRAADMAPELQRRAFRCAGTTLAGMPRLDSKRLALALALKKEFDYSYGPAWHCIVGTSFGSYVTHSVGGFLYFSIDKVYILLFKTAVEPSKQ